MRIRFMGRSLVGAIAVALIAAGARDAAACGMVLGSKTTSPFDYPYLSEERVLILWDKPSGTEHFVREVRFEKANQKFGFVVPTPSLPEVASVAKSPFPALAEGLPFEIPRPYGIGTGGGSKGLGSGGSPRPLAVEVLAIQRVGRFTAFTLAAHDAKAFRAWLEENDFATTPELETWLAHFVTLGFHFVAFRFDAKKDEAPGMTSEVVRLTFHSPLPYYPYFEPKPPTKQYVRRLTTWFMSQEKMRPIAARTREGKLELVQPWWAGGEYHPTHKLLQPTLGELASLLPTDVSELQVQTFRDRKVSREGMADIVFVPTSAQAAEGQALVERRAMMGWLDPALAVAVPPPAPAPSASLAPAPAPSPSTAPSPASSIPPTAPVTTGPPGGCTTSSKAAPAAWLWLAPLLLALARRRRALLTLATLALTLASACRRDEPPPVANAPITSASTFASAAPLPSAPASAAPLPSALASGAPEVPALPAAEKTAREALLLAALGGSFATPPKIEAGPYDDPPPTVVYKQPVPTKVDVKVVSGALPQNVVHRIVRANTPRMRFCFDNARKADPSLHGSVMLRFVIDQAGGVSMASIGGGTLANAQVAACMLGVMRSLSFPEPEGGIVTATARFTFDEE